MIPLYDHLGTPAAFYLEQEERFIFSWGASAAWLQLDSVYNYSGGHVGWWLDDRLLDHSGDILLFVEGAPNLPPPKPRLYKQFTPPKPAPNPGRCFTQVPPDRPLPRFAYSRTVFGVW
jgi:hypothetical protein